ncbi:T9SS type A sorting domain-containing protein [Fulvivirga sp. 29W222]|uniref:T9SS type A sorting domain-containing protein n=1 Tax=Fulvivirga marina TaxID=2494733 RepID=A0A937FVY1_9BACT|nr:T9SS type A sorting domain-containing protein [Fulvivirga marina]MBL6445350.1 T9SS type A sorting domain-containing protein [Fulvivirga marina]
MIRTSIKLALVCYLICLFNNFEVLGQSSGQITKPKVWLRADAGSITSSSWRDYSGNENHARLTTLQGNSFPVYFNFNPTRHFRASSDLSEIPYSLEGLSETTFIMVYQASDTTERGIIGAKDGQERNVMLTTSRVLGPDSVIDVFEQGNKLITMNTITQSWEDAKLPGEGASLTLGGIINTEEVNDFEGEIAEILVFDQVIPFMHKVQYETYLGIKYGISLKNRNYVSSREEVLWKADENEEFQYRITGIGRDDHFQLYQKQSVNVVDSTELIALSSGTLKEINEANTSIFSDQDFILWGDNNMSLVDHKGEGQDSILSMLDRKWLVRVNGPTASNISTSIYLDISQLPKDSLGFWLVIDRSGSGDFSADNLEYIKADSISKDSIAYYKVKWDTDLSGKDNFSFARMKDLFAVVRTLDQPICTDPESGRVKVEVIAGKGPFEFTWGSTESEEKTKYNSGDNLEIDRLSAGTYNLQVKDAQGIVFDRVTVLEAEDGIPVDLGPDQSLTENKEIILDATASIPDSVEVDYTWESSFGLRSTQGKIAVNESGIYRVFVTNRTNGCVFTDEITITGSPIERFEVFPNLITQNETFNVSISLKEPLAVQLRFFDLKGNLHAKLGGEGNAEYQFEVSLSKAGHYMVVLETPEGTSAKKIIVY